MNPDDLATAVESMILSASSLFETSIIKIQNKLYDKVFLILKDLELDADGNILQNTANRKILRTTQSQFDAIISSNEYQNAVQKQVDVIPKLAALNSAYFEGISKGFTPNKNFLKSLQTQTINNINSLILQEGVKAQVQIPLNQILEQNISTGGNFQGMLKQVQEYIIGSPEVEGRLLRYSKTFLRDALFQYSRSFQEAMTGDLKLDWYLYSGGIIDTTREFCAEKAGKFFHRTEIEQWPADSWKGKIPGTTASSIFVLLGGYNCSHSLIPVSEVAVPKEDLARFA